MDSPIEKKLSEMPAAELIKIIQAALAAMGETEQINFIAKFIDAHTALTRLGANDPEAFLDEVEEFCLDCLNGAYYSDEEDIETYFSENRYGRSYYDDDWDYGEYFSDSEWAENFARLFRLSKMYIQGGDFETGHEATARLLSCLKEMMSDVNFLGTDEPMSYISTDWHDLFMLSYKALFQHISASDRAIKLALRRWMDFGSYCDEGFLSNVKDIRAAERYMLEEIRASKDWKFQRKCFELLEGLYGRLGEAFDKAALASALIKCNIYFYLMVVEGLWEKGCWNEAVENACAALTQIQPAADYKNWWEEREHKEIRAAIQSKLTNAYEQLLDFEKAFETVKLMFKEEPSFELYKRARALSEKAGSASAFLVSAEGLLGKERHAFGFMSGNLLRDIYSYEGETIKMLDMARSQEIDRNYYDRKYIALSLIYRAVNDTEGVGNSLSEYLSSAAGQDGIEDMLLSGGDALSREELLLHGADMLRGIVSFHIGAAARNRYAKAAYYMCVLRDISIFLKREDEFKGYFGEVIQQNSRRPALRDEMGIVYGKEATDIKKKLK